MRHEACAQVYQKYDMRCVLGYEKFDMRRVHRVITNVTRDMCTRLSEIWQTCAQGYHKCDMRQEYRVIRNVI